MDRLTSQDHLPAFAPAHSSASVPLRAHRAPDPEPVEEPLPEQFPRPHPYPAHPVPQDDPVPDPNPS